MKIFSVLIVLPLATQCQNLQPTQINPHGGVIFDQVSRWEELNAKAKAENKYIFMDIYTSWCGPCKKMDKEVYQNSEVGAAMDSNFIAVKVQLDESDESIFFQKWHVDPREFSRQYHIEGYPSLLFFNSDGNLVYRDIGFKNVEDFLGILKRALDPKTSLYYSYLDEFKNGRPIKVPLEELANYAYSIGDYSLAKQIARSYIRNINGINLISSEKILFILNVARDRKLADSLANVYKSTVLDRLDEDQLCTTNNMNFISYFLTLLDTADGYFHLAYFSPEKIDSLPNMNGLSKIIVESAIDKELSKRFLKNERPVYDRPDWEPVKEDLQKKYPRLQIDRIVVDFQLAYFELTKEWRSFTQTMIDRVKKFGPYGLGGKRNLDFDLNNDAFVIFQHSSDPNELRIALAWADSAVKIATKAKPVIKKNLANWIDTKANIHYKLKNIKAAIYLEHQAIDLDSTNPEFENNLQKMKKGIITWLE